MAPRKRAKKHVPLEQLNIPPKGTKPAKISKKKLRQEASSRPVTDEEADALMDAFFKGHPYVAAILGQCMVEYDLDTLLRFALKVDGAMWKRLIEPDGPLGTFSRKTTTAAALGLVSEITVSKLRTIRIIRNHFAHSQRLLRFNDAHIVAELKSTKFMKTKDEAEVESLMAFVAETNEAAGLTVYRRICDLAAAAIIKRHNRGIAAASRNLGRTFKKLQAEVTHNPFSFSQGSGGLSTLLRIPPQTGNAGPTSPTPQSPLSEFLRGLAVFPGLREGKED
ncbi:hypothetical protein [Rhizorhabdus sp.]|jgi:hypothetical protein|uniref:hypothetical protein n=1 Tax=Rhizorhabdus sp. TaxID=1968843 RepID=UPI0025EC8AC2|nr:hypothetical protein [Rhizorhabdus sp.]